MAQLKDYKWVLALMVVLIFGTLLILNKQEQPHSETPLKSEQVTISSAEQTDVDSETVPTDDSQMPDFMYVDVKGEVHQPGVYRVTEGMRILDVIEDAGGFSNQADVDQVNLAMRVYDEMIIYVPNEHEVEQEEKLDLYPDQNHGKIRINAATKDELITLPGIGEKKAEAILKYIESNGPFQSPDDLTQVEGIGEKTVANFLEQIQVP
ncbi:MAG: helix-hairpin-helix domain-containing protein [Bacillota bacterium]